MQRKVPSAITNITLNRATFTDVSIDELTFVNFFYGNNGAGKSSIAHAIDEDDGVVWADGKTAADFDVLVYNQDFINDNFVNYGDLKGVFIFGDQWTPQISSVIPIIMKFYLWMPHCGQNRLPVVCGI